MKKLMLGIGDLVKVKNEEIELWTVLGSCVSIIFHIPDAFSLMCHAQLPELSREAQERAAASPYTILDIIYMWTLFLQK